MRLPIVVSVLAAEIVTLAGWVSAQPAPAAGDGQLDQAVIAADWQQVLDLATAWEQRQPKGLVPTWLAVEALVRLGHREPDCLRAQPLRDARATEPAALEALETWALALTEKHGDAAVAWELLAIARRWAQRYDEALQAADRAVALAPDDPSPHLARAGVNWDKGEYERAMQDYDQAAEASPKFPHAYVARGRAYSRGSSQPKAFRARPGRALKDFGRAIKLDKEHVAAYLGRASARYKAKDWDPAARDYTKAVELDPTCAEAYNGRGLVYFELGRRAGDSLPVLWTGTGGVGGTISVGTERTIHRMLHGDDYLRALQDFTTATELAPRYAEAWFNKGRVCERRRMKKKAIEAFQQVIALSPAGGTSDLIPKAQARLKALGVTE